MSLRGPLEEPTVAADVLTAEAPRASDTGTLEEEAGKLMARSEGPQVAIAGGLGRALRRLLPRRRLQGSGADLRAKTEKRLAEEAKAQKEQGVKDALDAVSEEASPDATVPSQAAPESTQPAQAGLDIDSDQFARDIQAAEAAQPLPARPSAGGEGRNINLNYVQNPDDWGKVLEGIQPQLPGRGVRTHAQVREEVAENAQKILAPLMKDLDNPRPLTDAQVYAAAEVTMQLTGQIDTLSQKIISGTATDIEKLQFQRASAAYGSWMNWFQQSRAETARALGAMKMISGVLDNPQLHGIADAISEGGGQRAVLAQAKLVQRWKAENNGDVIEGMTGLAKLTRKQRLDNIASMWQASILTGFRTHAVNFVSNVGVQSYELLVRGVAGAYGAAKEAAYRAAGKPPPERVYAGEAVHEFVGLMYANRDATKLAADSLKAAATKGDYHGHSVHGTMGGTKFVEAEAIGDEATLGQALLGENLGSSKVAQHTLDLYERAVKTTAYGALSSADQYFKELTYQRNLYGMAYRQASAEGLRGQARSNRMNHLINNPTEDMHKTALAEADRVTFTERPDGGMIADFANKTTEFIRNHPQLKYVVPFVRTPANLLRYTSENFPGLQFLTDRWRKEFAAGGARRDVAMARLAVGNAQLIATYALYDQGIITGAGPKNPDVRAALERTGWQPNSIRVGEQYIAYDRMDPFGMMIGVMADLRDLAAYSPDEQTATGMMAVSALVMANYAMDSTYLGNLNDLLGLIGDVSEQRAMKFAAKTVSGYIPALASSAADLTGSKPGQLTYDPNNPMMIFIQAAQNRMAVLRDEVPPRRHWDGQIKVPFNGVAWEAMSPARASYNLPVNYVDLDGERQFKSHDTASVELMQNNVSVGPPDPMLTIGGVRIPLMELDGGKGWVYDMFREEVGIARRQLVEQAIVDDVYLNAEGGPNSQKTAILTGQVIQARRAGTARFLERLEEKVNKEPWLYSTMAQLLGNEDVAGVIQQLREGSRVIDEDIVGFRAKGVRTREELPAPPHMRF